MTPIFRWNGEYFGYLKNDRLFNAISKYLGWVTVDGNVWRADGTYLGGIENINYILRKSAFVTLTTRSPKGEPFSHKTPSRRVDRTGRIPRVGYVDALDEFESVYPEDKNYETKAN